jgi:hypothetical protein
VRRRGREAAAISGATKKFSEIYKRLGLALIRPEWTTFDDEPLPAGIVTYQEFMPSERSFRSSEIDGSRPKVLCDEVRDTMLKLSALGEKKRMLGL